MLAVQIRKAPLCTCLMVTTSRVRKLGGAVTLRTVGVQFRKYAWQYTIPSHHSNANGILAELL